MIYITGDTHGTIDERFTLIHPNPEDHIIILGDFGFIWQAESSKREKELLSELRSIGATILFIDGNHENFDRLCGLPTQARFGADVGVVDTGIYHLRRGKVYTLEDNRFFTMGGALSIDKAFREEGISWWPQEQFSPEDTQRAIETLEIHNYEVDYILTHAAPVTLKKILLNGSNRFPNPTEAFLESIYPMIRFKTWLFGHYHMNRRIGDFVGLYNHWHCIE